MREKPDFGKKDSKKDTSLGCVSFLFIAVIGYLIFSAINRVMAGHGSRDDQYICYGTLICLVLVYFQAEREKKQEKQRLREVQQAWKNSCKSVEVVIMSRQSYSYESYFDDYGDLHNGKSSYSLDLETTADQKAANPNLTVVSVKVYSDIYEKLQDQKIVRIYYKPESPLTFLLEEELYG
jgi:hypothetical protein